MSATYRVSLSRSLRQRPTMPAAIRTGRIQGRRNVSQDASGDQMAARAAVP